MSRTLTCLAAAAWWAIVLLSSGEGASAEFTKQLLKSLLGLEGGALDLASLILRKSGHVMYYAILTGLLTASFRSVSVAVAVAGGTAVLDEARQSLFATRSGTPADLVYDGAGILVAVLLLRRYSRAGRFT